MGEETQNYGSGISLMSVDLLFEEDDDRYYYYTYDANNRLISSYKYTWALRYNKQSMTCINNKGGIGYEMGSYIYLNRERYIFLWISCK